MTSVDRMIAFALSKHHKVTYSMAYPQRLGPESLDCSSFVYYALIAGGFLPNGTRIGNTESLYKLKGRVFREIYRNISFSDARNFYIDWIKEFRARYATNSY